MCASLSERDSAMIFSLVIFSQNKTLLYLSRVWEKKT
jgi:hypothetical protein